MGEKGVGESSNRRQIRQPPSVPFIWEVKPGLPKKDWKPEVSAGTLQEPPPPMKLIAAVPFKWEEKPGTPLSAFSRQPESAPGIAKKDWKPEVSAETQAVAVVDVPPPPPPPMKLIAAVPFKWEEKPGTPLSAFSQQPESAPCTLPRLELVALPSPPMYWYPPEHEPLSAFSQQPPCTPPRLELIALPSPPMYWYPPEHDSCKYVNHDHQWEGNMDVESFRFGRGDSFSSTPPLLANSTAAPVPDTTPSSPVSETDSSTSSYATGMSSLEGPSFLERLFPLYSPNSEFIRKSLHSRRALFTPLELKGRNLGDESNAGVVVRRPPTLGELIMMSRRQSYQIKGDQLRKQNSSMECMNAKFLGCGIFGGSMKMIEGLQRKMQQARLKLI